MLRKGHELQMAEQYCSDKGCKGNVKIQLNLLSEGPRYTSFETAEAYITGDTRMQRKREETARYRKSKETKVKDGSFHRA